MAFKIRISSSVSGRVSRGILYDAFDRETIGLIGLTRVGSRRVVQIAAGFMICLSLLGRHRTQTIFGLRLGQSSLIVTGIFLVLVFQLG